MASRRTVVLEWLLLGLTAVALVVFLAALVELGRLDAGDPPHFDAELPGGVPVTLYLPPGVPVPTGFPVPDPPLAAARPPVVVLAHGFSSDRVMMGTLARWIASAGYGVVALDFAGHGANRNPFPGFSSPAALADDLSRVVEFARHSPYVDGTRIVLMGHSMGASAVADFATHDPELDGVVAISGGWQLLGPDPVPNALFVFAEKDPTSIRAMAVRLASRLAGERRIEPGRTYGELSARRAVRAVEVAGEDHVSILRSPLAAGEIIAWLDGIFGRQRPSPLSLVDPRLSVAGVAFITMLVLLGGIGVAVGRLVPQGPQRTASGGIGALAGLAIVLLATMPLMATGSPLAFLGLAVGDLMMGHLGLAGVAWLAGLALTGRLDRESWWPGAGRAALAGSLGFVAVYAVLVPLSVVFHRLTPTPERLAVLVASALAILPFFLAFEIGLRRGGTFTAALLGLDGRVVILGATWLAIRIGVFPQVVSLMLPLFAVGFFLIEIVAVAVYASSRNVVAIACFEALWVAWSTAATMPIRW
jgi:dienelactone hydrolase